MFSEEITSLLEDSDGHEPLTVEEIVDEVVFSSKGRVDKVTEFLSVKNHIYETSYAEVKKRTEDKIKALEKENRILTKKVNDMRNME